MQQSYKFGDEVECTAEKSKPGFVGVITFVTKNRYGETYYHVRDEFGEYWHRTDRDLKPVRSSVAA